MAITEWTSEGMVWDSIADVVNQPLFYTRIEALRLAALERAIAVDMTGIYMPYSSQLDGLIRPVVAESAALRDTAVSINLVISLLTASFYGFYGNRAPNATGYFVDHRQSMNQQLLPVWRDDIGHPQNIFEVAGQTPGINRQLQTDGAYFFSAEWVWQCYNVLNLMQVATNNFGIFDQPYRHYLLTDEADTRFAETAAFDENGPIVGWPSAPWNTLLPDDFLPNVNNIRGGAESLWSGNINVPQRMARRYRSEFRTYHPDATPYFGRRFNKDSTLYLGAVKPTYPELSAVVVFDDQGSGLVEGIWTQHGASIVGSPAEYETWQVGYDEALPPNEVSGVHLSSPYKRGWRAGMTENRLRTDAAYPYAWSPSLSAPAIYVGHATVLSNYVVPGGFAFIPPP